MGSPMPPKPEKLPGWLKKALNALLKVLQLGKDLGYYNKGPKP